jgi:hypothetical protein
MLPYFVLCGQEPPLPSFSDLAVEEIKDKSAWNHVQKLKERVKAICDEAQRLMEKRCKVEEERYNRKAGHVPYKEGDMVYTRVPRKESTKIEPQWAEPLQVTRRRSSPHGEPGTTYVCKKPDGSLCERNFEQLKKVKAPIEKALEAATAKEDQSIQSCVYSPGSNVCQPWKIYTSGC